MGNLFPLDAQLNLPAQGYSHRLQKRVSVKAANALFDAEDTRAPERVAGQIERVLRGKARSVVRRLRRAATTGGLSGKQREPLDQCFTYPAK